MATSPGVTRKKRGLFPASFDPLTVAHVGIAERAARTLDHLFVTAALHPKKKYEFSPEEKFEFMAASLGHIANVEVIPPLLGGLTVDHARRLGATVMIRGARSVTDFLDEIELFSQNLFVQESAGIGPDHPDFVDTQTFYVLPGQDHVSSTLVRGLMKGISDVENRAERIRPLVPDPVFEAILPRLPKEG